MGRPGGCAAGVRVAGFNHIDSNGWGVDMNITDLEVQALGATEEHKVKAILSDGVWCTYYVNAGYVSLHDPKRGGLGRFSESEFSAPQVLAVLREAYRLREGQNL